MLIHPCHDLWRLGVGWAEGGGEKKKERKKKLAQRAVTAWLPALPVAAGRTLIGPPPTRRPPPPPPPLPGD
jgi:hypothetical protein